MTKYTLAAMTQAEFADRIKDPVTILIPLGSQEVQGPHAPMGDFRLTERLAEMSADAGDGIAAPVLPFGYADFFRGFAGGIQLRPQTFSAVLEDVIVSFLDHGVERLLIFNGHSANGPLVDQVARKIRRERGVAVPSLNIWKSIPDTLWTELYGDEAGAVRGHGGEPMSSAYAYLFPERIRPDLIADKAPRGQAYGLDIHGISGVRFEGQPLNLPIDAHEVDPAGMLGGSARGANAERGRAICEHIVSHTARLIRHMTTCDPRKMLSGR
ncbi:creatininase family protein [Pelagibacterium halotolerans]|uniref:creatininase family protein n=1 Tax=Pelagibacterium halotolerans TaxID=531813 RepID=UPI00384CA5AB